MGRTLIKLGGKSGGHVKLSVTKIAGNWKTEQGPGAILKDYYEILGVSPTSDFVVIRAAFKAMMLKYHPDTNKSADASDKAKELNEAFAILSDPAKRTLYDRQRTSHLEEEGKTDQTPPHRLLRRQTLLPRRQQMTQILRAEARSELRVSQARVPSFLL
jgi:curved DNA-binding protein CbpA